MNRWIVAAVLFATGVAVGVYLYRREVRFEYRLHAVYSGTSNLKAVAIALGPATDANIMPSTHGTVTIEAASLDYARRLAEKIANRASARIVETQVETIEHPDADGLAVGCITGYLAALGWIRFAPRKQKDLAL